MMGVKYHPYRHQGKTKGKFSDFAHTSHSKSLSKRLEKCLDNTAEVREHYIPLCHLRMHAESGELTLNFLKVEKNCQVMHVVLK